MTGAAIEFTSAEVAAYYRVRVPNLKQQGPEWRGPCPIHGSDHRPDSFAVQPATGQWFCHSECNSGGDILDLEMALNRTKFSTAKPEVFRIVGRQETNGSRNGMNIVAAYNYNDENGILLYQVVRLDPKGFLQRRPDGDDWIWSTKGVRQVLYRLPELVKRKTEMVFICEGEKDVEAIESLGLLATTNSGGAGKWRAEHSEALRERQAIILFDNDEPGRKHAATEAADLLRVDCKVGILELPGAKDAAEWITAGGTLAELDALIEQLEPLTEATLADWRAKWGLATSNGSAHAEEPPPHPADAGEPSDAQHVSRRTSGPSQSRFRMNSRQWKPSPKICCQSLFARW